MRALSVSAAALLGAGLFVSTAGAAEAAAAAPGSPSIVQLTIGRTNLGATGGAASIRLNVRNGDTCWFTAPAAVQIDRSHRGCQAGRDWTVVRLGRTTSTTTTRYGITGWVRGANGALARQSVVLQQAGLVPLALSVSSHVTVGTAFAEQLGVTGGHAPYTMSVTAGSLPPGISLSSSGDLSGTPTTVGSYTATVTVTDSTRPQPQRTSLTVGLTVTAPPISVTTTSLPAGSEGTYYDTTLAATGGTAPYSWALVSGSLPSGLTLSPSGVLAGTPATSGSYTVTVRATDSTNPPQSVTSQLTLSIQAATLDVTTTALPNATPGTTYSQTLSATGGTAPYTWTLASGSLPPGLLLSSTGAISGTPYTTGTFAFSVQVTDASQPQQSATRYLSITVSGSTLTISTTSLPSGTVGVYYSQSVTATGGTGSYTWSLVGGSLPPNLNLSASTGQIYGAPSASGTYSFTLQARDTAGNTASKTLQITVVN